MAKFRKHIVGYRMEDVATTFCGISSDKCSEDFYESNSFVDVASYRQATCKRCINKLKKELSRFSDKDI
jgi:hypothetical protein